ncbi:MAG: type I secretion system permease/ATPase [Pseudomonadota bacterium]
MRNLAVFSICINLLMLTVPIYLLQVYDRVLTSSSLNTLFFISLAALLAIAVMSLLDGIRFLYSSKMASQIDASLSEPLLKASLVHSGGAADASRLRDLTTVRTFLEQRNAIVVFDLPFVLIFTALLFFIHPTLGAITLAGVFLLAFIAALQYWFTKKHTISAAMSSSSDMTHASVLAREAPTIRALGMVDAVTSNWGGQHAQGLVHNAHASGINAYMTGISKFIRMILQLAILGLGAFLVLSNQMTAGMIFAASIVSGRALQPIDQLVGSWRMIFDARAAWKRVKQSAAQADLIGDVIAREAPAGLVRVDDLTLAVPDKDGKAKILLAIKNAVFEPGTLTAVVGPSGSGKSTLLRVISGAQEGYRGSVRVDSTALANWDRGFLGSQIGYLAQEVELLPGTIGQNIARFMDDASDAEIINASKAAKVNAVIEALPDGYDTRIHARTPLLSGGQKQLVALARALFRSPPILIMDEPNANLDAYSKDAYKRVLGEARKAGKTLIVATHDPNLYTAADRVLLLEEGHVSDYDAPEQVIGRRKQQRQKTRKAANTESSSTDTKPALRIVGEGSHAADTGNNIRSPFSDYGPGMKPIAKDKS